MRALTFLFVVLILMPGAVLAWLGWQSAATFETQARELARRQAEAVAAKVQSLVTERSGEIEKELRLASRGAAERIRRLLPAESAGTALDAAWQHLVGDLGSDLGGGASLCVLDEKRAIRLPAPPERADLSQWQEGPEFRERRQLAERVELIARRPAEAGRLLEALGDDLATTGLKALAWSHAAGAWRRAGRPERAAAVLTKARSLNPSRALAGGPLVIERQLEDEKGRLWVSRLAAAADLVRVPATDRARRDWWQRCGLEPPRWLTNNGEGAIAFHAPIAEQALLQVSIPADDLWSELLPAEIDGVRILREREPSDDDVEVFVEALGSSTRILARNPAFADVSARSAVRRAITALGISGLLLLMILGLLLVRRSMAREEAARRLREDFIANVSHDLRTPLTSIRMHAEMLAESELDGDTRRRYGEVVEAEGARLASLVDDLLDFAALAQGRRRLEPSPVDLAAAARDAAAAWQPLARREGVALDTDADGEVAAMADPTALSRILANLMQNAWRHGRPPRDGGPPRVRLRAGPGPLLEVRDNGPGLPPEERASVFDRFHRGPAADGKGGAGIGLALSRELARAQGGDLEIDDDGETVFRLTLPPVADPGDTAPDPRDTGEADD